ncbi:hypothetical protein [Paraburkholderia humisilvae]|uniref:Uncharacterized protein n=1 Tax=Paraburkholderia humisilvae TaxID=627669 RepID=A0A6J5EQL7_9BURK|nr:hypothetical protein [Paraburkholderia humisilvae]CAB3767522.1 hypothetical protein LMG29542_05631 [Paraburkholderia humisilvae]
MESQVINLAGREFRKKTKGAVEVPVACISRQGDAILSSVLRSAERKAAARPIFLQWPRLQQSALKFCEILSDRYPGAVGSLVDEAIQHAIERFVEVYETSRRSTDSMVAFLESLALSADVAMEYSAVGFDESGNRRIWPPFEEPIGSWARRLGLQKVRFVRVPPAEPDVRVGNRFLLCSRIMTAKDIGRVSELPSGALDIRALGRQ